MTSPPSPRRTRTLGPHSTIRLEVLATLAIGALVFVIAAAALPEQTTPGSTGAEPYPIGTRQNFTAPEYSSASFRSMERIFSTRRVPRSESASPLARASEPFTVRYRYEGAERGVDELVARTETTGLLVLHDGTILHEGYYRGADETSRFLSMSVGKSFVSTLVGLAIAEKLIASVDEPVTRYLPELRGTGYDGVSIEHILQMSSGIAFTEEYDQPDSDVFKLFAPMIDGVGRLNQVAASFGRAREPGSKFYYASNDTQILGMLVARVTGKTLSAWMAEKLWSPLGAESDALWLTDRPGDDGMEMAFGGLNVTLRDYGRFGLLMAREGKHGGRQLLPGGWVERATVPHSPQVMPGKLYPGYAMGYGYQWWCFPPPGRAFTGQGVFGQLLMVDPDLDLVVVKTSAWPVAWDDAKEAESYAFFDAVREHVRARRASRR
jgi:CubicO group peptidase (beta-lactamase class C family)